MSTSKLALRTAKHLTRLIRIEMSESDGQSIRCVTRRSFRQSEQGPDHEGHLVLGSLTAPDDGLLDPFRGIFVDGQSGFGNGDHGGSPGGAQDDRGLETLHVDDPFDGAHCGLIFRDHCGDLSANGHEAARLGQ